MKGGERARRRRRWRRSLLAVVAALYVVSVPWYRTSDGVVATWLGLPDWVTVAVLCYVAAALLNAAAWLLTDLHDGPGPEG